MGLSIATRVSVSLVTRPTKTYYCKTNKYYVRHIYIYTSIYIYIHTKTILRLETLGLIASMASNCSTGSGSRSADSCVCCRFTLQCTGADRLGETGSGRDWERLGGAGATNQASSSYRVRIEFVSYSSQFPPSNKNEI